MSTTKMLTTYELLFRVTVACLVIRGHNASESKDLMIEEQIGIVLNDLNMIQRQLGISLLEDKTLSLTRLLDEHPEEWDGPCECQLCLSYGD